MTQTFTEVGHILMGDLMRYLMRLFVSEGTLWMAHSPLQTQQNLADL